MNTLIVDAKSGTSGAGRGAKVPNLFCEVNENMKAYGVASHRHTPEIEEQLGYASGEKVLINFNATSGSDEQSNPGDGICNIEKRCDLQIKPKPPMINIIKMRNSSVFWKRMYARRQNG